MALRDYLEQRERELLEELGELRSKITPMEAELAEIRRAKVAIGMGNALTSPSFFEGIGSLGALADLNRDVVFGPPSVANSRTENAAIDRTTNLAKALQSSYEHLTMKQLVVKALEEHF